MAPTVQYASAPRIRPLRPEHPPSAPMTDHQREEATKAARESKTALDKDVAEWLDYTFAKVTELSKKHNKDEHYFYDLFFGGGLHMVNHHNKINAFNAFLSIKARDHRLVEGKESLKLEELQVLHLEEYHALDDAQRLAYVEQFKALKTTSVELQRPTPRSRIQDVSNVIRNIELLLVALQRRAGVQAMVCIFRNTAAYVMDLQWFFTNPEIKPYLPMAVGRRWDTSQVGARLEAFAIAGCDTARLFKTVQQKVEYYKMAIRNRVNQNLRQITGNSNIQMQYVHFESRIVIPYGIDIVGWNHPTFGNPSELSSSLDLLKKLYEALLSGKCKFVTLTEAEHDARTKEYEAKVVNGDNDIPQRQQRKDAGKKRGPNKRTKNRKAQDGTDDEESDEEEDDEDDEEEDNEDDEEPARTKSTRKKPTTKRCRTQAQDDDEDEEPTPPKTTRKKPAPKCGRKQAQDQDVPPPPAKRAQKEPAKPVAKRGRWTTSQPVVRDEAGVE
ncbi:hypothetical protein BDN72DRAFT_906209 [Pluteus cervinus]|uniref:Uncharacterized protein n=1 Tax=Pluteus cervinus TaxID=181527 RepID=A0ACD2ZZP4_9AGAR|nr:hypothetical protein BDN72DRAFT_906209 [Pluteus cervinus]